MILSVLDILASLFCSITIFSVLGAMAHDLKLDSIDSLVSPGLHITIPIKYYSMVIYN